MKSLLSLTYPSSHSQAIDQIVEKETKDLYLQTISTPMDLTKISKLIDKYQSVEGFESDIRLMLDNCRSFNGPGLLSDVSYFILDLLIEE